MAAKILVNGFDTDCIVSANDDQHDGLLRWFCAPDSWPATDGKKREGKDGKWRVQDKTLTIHPAAKKDYWRRTYYEPLLIKDDGALLYATLDSSKHYTVETRFQLQATNQFDQAGLMIRLDAQHWIKTGIEVVDRQPRLSAVVTNVYSDWSTQAWSAVDGNNNDDSAAIVVECRLRVHCRGPSFVIEAQQAEKKEWEFLRIAHLSDRVVVTPDDPAANDDEGQTGRAAPGTFWAGVFACCPEEQKGGHAHFTTFTVTEGSSFDHNAESNLE